MKRKSKTRTTIVKTSITHLMILFKKMHFSVISVNNFRIESDTIFGLESVFVTKSRFICDSSSFDFDENLTSVKRQCFLIGYHILNDGPTSK